MESNKLGCLLAQFPANMPQCKATWDYLLALPDALNNLPLVYEFRNKSWVSEKTVQRLKSEGIGFCTVDEPKIGPLMPLVPAVTSDIAYLRLHGRSKNWFSNPELRYDYLYSKEELKKFLPTINSMAEKSKAMYIAFNNCHVGPAARNVKDLQDLLGIDLLPAQGTLF